MFAAFLVSALAYAALFAALRSEVRGRPGRIGAILLLLCAIGTTGVGLFTTEPITVPFDALPLRGILHVASGALAMLLLPIAALLVSLILRGAIPIGSRRGRRSCRSPDCRCSPSSCSAQRWARSSSPITMSVWT